MDLKIELENTRIEESRIQASRQKAQDELAKLWSGDLDFTGWVKDPLEFGEDKIGALVKTAEEIRGKCDYFIVLGVGGSFMGAKAVIDILAEPGSGTEVLFAGYNFNGRYLKELISKTEGKDVCLCVISKSGTTTETLSAYGIFKKLMLEKYGKDETAKRTYVVTENRSNFLFDEATDEGCTIFDLPVDIGGRYSVLTPVGLLPIAVAGIDIKGLMKGASDITDKGAFADKLLDYAIVRNIYYNKGRRIEVFEFFDPYFAFLGEWLKQLFGETEGKEGRGLFPVSLMFSRDLHSMGQFLQQGTQDFFETFITIEEPEDDVEIPEIAMKPFAGKTIEQINKCAEKGVLAAHVNAGIPAVSIKLKEVSPESIGELLYFFETECAVSALLSGVDPFNQPGVEAYKKEMRAYINQL